MNSKRVFIVLALWLMAAASAGCASVPGVKTPVAGGEARPADQSAPTAPTRSLAPTPTSSASTVARPLTGTTTGLIYRTSQGLWAVAADGRDVRLFDRPEAVLSPDGRRALYSDGLDIWLAEIATGERRKLTATPDRRETAPAWWPEQPNLALFASQAITQSEGAPISLAAVGLDGQGYTLLDEQHCMGDNYSPSPDGQTIACGGRVGWLYRRDGNSQAIAANRFGLPTGQAPLGVGSPAWSPDGRLLAWNVAVPGSEDGLINVTVLDLQNDTVRILHTYNPVNIGGWPPAPVWSPDQKWLAFQSWDEKVTDSGVWAVNLETTSPVSLRLGQRTRYPVWSPSGDLLTYTGLPNSLGQETWLGEVSAWQPVSLGLPQGAQIVDWRAQPPPLRMLDPIAYANTGGPVVCSQVYPGLAGCERPDAPVGGRLAFKSEAAPFRGRTTTIDFQRGLAWILGTEASQPVAWSPDGNYLILYGQANRWYGPGYRVFPYNVTEPTLGEGGLFLFWAPVNALPRDRQWLAYVDIYGSLAASSLPGQHTQQLLPYDSLQPKNGVRGTVIWATNNWLAWSLAAQELTRQNKFEQVISVRPAWSDEVRRWPVSKDVRQTYYQLVDWVPDTHLLLAGKVTPATESSGVPLVSINIDNGQIRELGVSMLLTPEAYAWRPGAAGQLALAVGDSRYLFETGRLALLDVEAASVRYLTDETQAAFEPAWSPDGRLLAYAAVQATPGATGGVAERERTLLDRAIYILDIETGKARQVTNPSPAIDGWPHWTADSARLLYARIVRQGDTAETEVRSVRMDGSDDLPLVRGLPGRTCHSGGCNWGEILAYYPGETSSGRK